MRVWILPLLRRPAFLVHPPTSGDADSVRVQVVEAQRTETAASLASLESRLCATGGGDTALPAAAQPVTPGAASDLAAALARAEDEVNSLRQGNAALQAALEHASKLMTTVRQEASDARKAREEESQVIAEELQSAHRATAEAVAEAASLRAEVMRLEAALDAVQQQGGGEVTAMEDPPVEAVPAPVADRAPAVGAVASDLNAALVAARARAQAAEENLHAARDAATAMVASAPQWNRYSGAAAL
jgi:small-conductance mechanosensitive channel